MAASDIINKIFNIVQHTLAVSEDCYRVRIDVKINPENCIDLEILFERLYYFYIAYCFYREKFIINY